MPHARLTQQEFNRQLWRAIIPPLLLLVAHASVIVILLLYWLGANLQSRQCDRVLAGTNNLERLFVNMETGIRGYLLSGHDEFLIPHTAAKSRLPAAQKELRAAIADRPAQIERLNSVDELSQQWFKLEPALYATPGVAADNSQLINSLNERRQLMESIRRKLHEIILAESSLKSVQHGRETWAALVAVVGGVGVSIITGIGLALINRRTVLRLSGEYQHALDLEAGSHRQFLDLAEAIPQMIWISDSRGRPLYFNHVWTDYTGCSGPQLSLHGWDAALHPEDQPSMTQQWNRALHSGEPFEGEFRLKQAGTDSYRWFLSRATPVVDQQGQRVRWFGTCTDIDAQKQAERQRESVLLAERAARTDLLRANTIKDQFLATLSHELRTPMGAILGWVRLLRDPVVRSQKLDRALDAIDTNAKAQARLIDDLLDMSRIITGKLTINAEPIDLRRIVRAAVDSITPAAQEKGVRLVANIDEQMPALVHGDPARLQQVVLNLLSNAVKFTPAAGTVTLSLRHTAAGPQIVVHDTGEGIGPEFLPHVFDRFAQGDGSTTRRQGGLGLGLAIVKHLVDLHGGSVTAASDGVGRGATFTMQLPAPQAQAGPAPADPSAARPDISILSGKRVLVVDDDPNSAAIAQTILERAGATVQTAGSASEAMQAMQTGSYDALISDIAMPDVDGYTLIHQVRKLPGAAAAVPALALTAFARPDDRDAALRAGYNAHLAKPISPDELLRELAMVLSNSRPSVIS